MVKSTSEKPAERSDSKYKGVRKRKWGKWVSEIRLPNSRERIWLGSYDSAEKAARAFDAALFCLRGRTAKFNFPHSPPEIAGGRSLKPAQIQTAAAQFAHSAPSTTHSEQSTSKFQTEPPSPSPSPSPSLSVSNETVQLNLDGEIPMDMPFLDLLSMGSGPFESDYGIFPGFDDLSIPMPTIDYGEENFDASTTEGSFLWNFDACAGAAASGSGHFF